MTKSSGFDQELASLNCFHGFKVVEDEEERLEVEVEVVDTMEVGGEGAIGCLGVIRWREEGDGRGIARLEKTGILSEGVSLADLHLQGTVILQCGMDHFHF